MYVIRAPSSINFFWNIIKGFMEENTLHKIGISKTIDLSRLLPHCNIEQIEAKFGGSAENVVHYWPPYCPS